MLLQQVVGMARNGWTASIGIHGRHSPDYAYKVREFINNEQGNRREFEGQVKTVYRKSGYITPDLISLDIYFVPGQCFGIEAKRGMRVRFEIGFNLFGPIAQQIRH